MSYYVPRHTCGLLLILLLCTFQAFAQDYPPSQGPPTSLRASYKTYSMSNVLKVMESEIQRALDSLNLKVVKQKDTTGVQAQINYTYKAFPPYMTTTTYADQPNQHYMRMPLIITYHITNIKWKGAPSIPRKIHQFVDIISTCKNWFTDQGKLNFTFDIQKPYADDRSSKDLVVNFFLADKLTTLIDRQLRTNLLPAFKQSMDSLANCNCLDVNVGKDWANHYKDTEIRYDSYNGRSSAAENIEISLVSLKRLYAHTYPDFKILYKEEEDVQLVFYANQLERVLTVNKIKEEQERKLVVENISFQKPSNKDLLILIANLKFPQLPQVKKLTEVVYFNKFNNFGNGIQKIILYKPYRVQMPQLPSGEIPQAYEAQIPAYELTIRISITKPQAIMVKN